MTEYIEVPKPGASGLDHNPKPPGVLRMEVPRIVVTGKEGLRELVDSVTYESTVKVPAGGILQVGAYFNPLRHLDLLEIVDEAFENVQFLIYTDPDLQSRFEGVLNRLLEKNKKHRENIQIVKEYSLHKRKKT